MSVSQSLSDNLTGRARLFEAAAAIAVVLLVLDLLRQAGVVALIFGALEAARGGGANRLGAALADFLRALIPLLPTFILLGAVLTSRAMFGRVARGDLFGAANSRAFADIGGALLWASLAAMILVPTLAAFVDGGRNLGVRVETESLVLAVVGGAVMVLGGMMARAQAENETLKAELSDFV